MIQVSSSVPGESFLQLRKTVYGEIEEIPEKPVIIPPS
jgi:hypothetical protein